MNATMTERFNVAGALLVKLFGLVAGRERIVLRPRRGCDIGIDLGHVRPGVFVALTLVAAPAQALVCRTGAVTTAHRAFDTGDGRDPFPAPHPAVRTLTALSNARSGHHECIGQLRPGLEVLDLAPMVDDAPDATELPRDARSIEFADVRFTYPTAHRYPSRPWKIVAVLDTAPAQEVLHGGLVPS